MRDLRLIPPGAPVRHFLYSSLFVGAKRSFVKWNLRHFREELLRLRRSFSPPSCSLFHRLPFFCPLPHQIDHAWERENENLPIHSGVWDESKGSRTQKLYPRPPWRRLVVYFRKELTKIFYLLSFTSSCSPFPSLALRYCYPGFAAN